RYLDFVQEAGAEQLIRQNRAIMARPDARRHLPELRCPVLMVCGDADQLTPLEHAREIVALLPQARLEILAQCGHMLTMEQPERVNALLSNWLASLPPRAQDAS
ncbi:MAG: alpha/beta fold hydrolase, partial [Burkholderiaceae bacterium]